MLKTKAREDTPNSHRNARKLVNSWYILKIRLREPYFYGTYTIRAIMSSLLFRDIFCIKVEPMSQKLKYDSKAKHYRISDNVYFLSSGE